MEEPEWLKQARAEGRITEGRPVAVSLAQAEVVSPPPVAKGMIEAEFQQKVIQAAQDRGWRVAHFRKVRVQRKGGSTYWETPVAADGKGFFDLELVRERLVKIELKVDYNKPTPEQEEWCTAYTKAGVEWYVFFPEDWETILKTLQ